MFQWHSPPLCNALWVSASFLLVMNIWVVFSFSLLYIMLQHIVSKLKVQTMNIPWHLPCAVHPCHPAPGRTCHIAGAQDKLVSGWMELGDRVTSLVWVSPGPFLRRSRGTPGSQGAGRPQCQGQLPWPVVLLALLTCLSSCPCYGSSLST